MRWRQTDQTYRNLSLAQLFRELLNRTVRLMGSDDEDEEQGTDDQFENAFGYGSFRRVILKSVRDAALRKRRPCSSGYSSGRLSHEETTSRAAVAMSDTTRAVDRR